MLDAVVCVRKTFLKENKMHVLFRGVARTLIWVGINEFVLGQGDKTTT